MLCNVHLPNDFILNTIAHVNGNRAVSKKLRDGVYEIGHFGSSHWPGDNWEHIEYGVCDDVEQILDHHPMLEETNRKFFVTLTPIVKANQPEEGGWRWHKWGPYIGTQKPTTEYIYDEPLIEKVYVYGIYQQL